LGRQTKGRLRSLPIYAPAIFASALAEEMPTVSVFHDSLEAALNQTVTEESFQELCFEFGLELDDVTNDYEIALRERGAAAAEGLSQRTIYKVDVPANRYDLLCIEGLVRALKVFKCLIPVPTYTLSSPRPQANMKITVNASVAQIRAFCTCAVLRDVTFDEDRYASFIDLQDKLHQNLCRRRTLVSMGTHDLATLKPPFTYEALPPKDIVFVPLSQTEKMDGHRMMEVLSQHQQLKAYLPIIRDSPVYPVIFDSNRVVCSLPPIINSEHSKIRLSTKDVFIECTATDLTKANIVLNTVVAMFAEHCARPFVAEAVEVVYADDYPANTFAKPGSKFITPDLNTRPMPADISRMKQALSLNHLTGEQVRDLIRRMSIPCDIDKKDPNVLRVDVPVTRSDIMHECDLVEDVAIAYGYNNLRTEVPQTYGGASQQPINHLTELLRIEMGLTGWTECYNWALVSRRENYDMLRHEPKPEELWRPVARPREYLPCSPAVSISNPKTKDFEILRTTLLPGVLKCLASNKHLPPPIRLFEMSDIVIQEPTRDVGARNVRYVCAVNAGSTPQFAVLHGVLDQLMYALNCCPEHEEENSGKKKRTFRLVPSDDCAFLTGRQAHIVVDDSVLGIIGELHPEVINSRGFDVNLATSAFELNVEPFLEWL